MTHKIFVCANDEALASCCVENYDVKCNEFRSVTRAGDQVVYDHPRRDDVETEHSRIFSAWHGGQHDQAGQKIGQTVFGYKCGFACTHSRNPPRWLCDLIDSMHEAMVCELAKFLRLAASESRNRG